MVQALFPPPAVGLVAPEAVVEESMGLILAQDLASPKPFTSSSLLHFMDD